MSKAILIRALRIIHRRLPRKGKPLEIYTAYTTNPDVVKSHLDSLKYVHKPLHKACRKGSRRQNVLDCFRLNNTPLKNSQIQGLTNLSKKEVESSMKYLQQVNLIKRLGAQGYVLTQASIYADFLAKKEAIAERLKIDIINCTRRHINNKPIRANTLLSRVLQKVKSASSPLTTGEITASLSTGLYTNAKKKINLLTVSTYLARLVEQGAIENVGYNRGYRYKETEAELKELASKRPSKGSTKLDQIYKFIKEVGSPVAAKEVTKVTCFKDNLVRMYLSSLVKSGRVRRENHKYFIGA